jgi:hypothetical protein
MTNSDNKKGTLAIGNRLLIFYSFVAALALVQPHDGFITSYTIIPG